MKILFLDEIGMEIKSAASTCTTIPERPDVGSIGHRLWKINLPKAQRGTS